MKTTYDANILTYCQWRDDLTMEQSPFCHVDNLIFCCLAYLNWDGIAEGFTVSESVSLRDAAKLWESQPAKEQKLRVETDRELLRQTAASRRFGVCFGIQNNSVIHCSSNFQQQHSCWTQIRSMLHFVVQMIR